MTNATINEKSTPTGRAQIISVILLSITVFFGIALSGEAAEYVKEGMRLAVGCVIPSSFPFMIISDVYAVYGRPQDIRMLTVVVSRVLGIPESGLGAFICGNVGGFPIGAKLCADLYESGALTREDAERLLPLSSNPSVAFLIGGVGIGMWGDARVGVILLLSLFLSTLLCGLLTNRNINKNHFYDNNYRQNYNFIVSVKKSGTSCVGIIAYISVFSVVLGIIKKRVKYASLLYIIFSFSEVTNAVCALSKEAAFPPQIRLAWCAFSLGFGGLCVGMQSAYFASSVGLSMKKYYAVKLLEGVLAASISTLLYSL